MSNNRNTNQGNKLRTYRIFKNDYHLEPYISTLKFSKTRSYLAKFRLSSHKLPIETGRYNKTPINERVCPCNNTKNEVGDEKHLLLSCSFNKELRTKLFHEISTFHTHFTEINNDDKFIFLMKTTDTNILIKICLYIENSMNQFTKHSKHEVNYQNF